MMYIRRKVFSIIADEVGEEKLFSVNETALCQKEFGAHSRKQKAKAERAAKYVEINANKAKKAEKRANDLLKKGKVEEAEKALQKAERHATQSTAAISKVTEQADKIAKTHKNTELKNAISEAQVNELSKGREKIAEKLKEVKSGKYRSKLALSKTAKIGLGVAAGAAAVGTGAYLYKKNKKD